MTDIIELWRTGRLPAADALHLADGRSFAITVVDGAVRVGPPLDLATAGTLSSIDIDTQVPAPGGWVCTGGGNDDREGYVARLDEAQGLVWVCHLSGSTPFVELAVADGVVLATAASGQTVALPLEAPEPA